MSQGSGNSCPSQGPVQVPICPERVGKLWASYDIRSLKYWVIILDFFLLSRDQNLVNDMDYAIGCFNIGNDHIGVIYLNSLIQDNINRFAVGGRNWSFWKVAGENGSGNNIINHLASIWWSSMIRLMPGRDGLEFCCYLKIIASRIWFNLALSPLTFLIDQDLFFINDGFNIFREGLLSNQVNRFL